MCHSKHHLVSSRQHRATEVRILHFRSSCQYTHGCCAPASWATQHTTVCLDILLKTKLLCSYQCILPLYHFHTLIFVEAYNILCSNQVQIIMHMQVLNVIKLIQKQLKVGEFIAGGGKLFHNLITEGKMKICTSHIL